jgi:hypothetical protein
LHENAEHANDLVAPLNCGASRSFLIEDQQVGGDRVSQEDGIAFTPDEGS